MQEAERQSEVAQHRTFEHEVVDFERSYEHEVETGNSALRGRS